MTSVEVRLENQQPCLLKHQLNLLNNFIIETGENNDTYIPIFKHANFQKKVREWINQPERKGKYDIHTCSKKKGAMLYPTDRDMQVEIIHTLIRNQDDDDELEEEFQFTDDVPDYRASKSEIMHTLMEIREDLKLHKEISDHYRENPEDMLNLTTNKLLMDVRPLTFNALYYLTCSNKEARAFVENPILETIDMAKFKIGTNPSQYQRTLQLLFDVLHQLDEKLCYPLHIMWSDLIANSKPISLMDSMSRSKRCVGCTTYFDFRKQIASRIENKKADGDMPGIDPNPDQISAIHMDNLEQVQRYGYKISLFFELFKYRTNYTFFK